MIKVNDLDEYQTLETLMNYARSHKKLNNILALNNIRECEECDLEKICRCTDKCFCELKVEFEGE